VAEGDTIHRHARRIAAALGEAPIRDASAPNPRSTLRLSPQRLRSLAGKRLERADAHGKHLFLRFEGGLTLHAHQGMSGSWQVFPDATRAFGRIRSAWVVLVGSAAAVAEFGGPKLALRTEAELRADPRLASLGPDLLDPEFEVEKGVGALRAADRGRELGEALLDQRVLAGIGNVYKSEACFAARLDPWTRLGELSEEELSGVVVESASLMRAGLETGVRPRDVYRRAGQPCLRCGEPIRSRGQGDSNRMTYWCPRCQR
jgi:endonuclease-8